MKIFEKNTKLDIYLSKNFNSGEVSIYKDMSGVHLKINDHTINSLDTLDKLNVSKITDFLYSIEYKKYDYSLAEEFFSKYVGNIGLCSSCRVNNLYGRNYDWLYDNTAEFVIKVSQSYKRHASIGVAAGLKTLSNLFVESGEYSDLYNILPFMTVDGINDAGVVCNINVVPNDLSNTVGTNKGKKRINALSIVRYILDNADSASHAVKLLKNIDIWVPKISKYEYHYMIADSTNTYCIEFIDNGLKILDLSNDVKIMTNFNLWTSHGVLHPETILDLSEHGSGFERYELLKNLINSVETENDLLNVMRQVNFTNLYKNTTNPPWYSDLLDGALTNKSSVDDLKNQLIKVINAAKDMTRDGKFWQTVHTSIYNINDKSLTISCQENSSSIFKYNV